jgi:methyl-accepting chemotaxis protein
MQGSKIHDTLSAFQTIQNSITDLCRQTDTIHAKVKRAEADNESLIDAIQHVAAIAEETAAGVQEVNSTSIEQDESVRRIAEQADAIHVLAESLFTEIGKFKTPDHAGNTEHNGIAYTATESAKEPENPDLPGEIGEDDAEPAGAPVPNADTLSGQSEGEGGNKKEEEKQLVTA